MFVKALCFVGFTLIILYSIIPTGWYKLKKKLINTGNRKPKASLDSKVDTTEINDNVIYLTFDDGPDKRFTSELLDLLKKYKIRASFFVVAKFAEENKDIIERMKKEGHLIGFHSLEHRNALWQTPRYTKTDFEFSKDIFESLGVKIKYFRPPWGHFNIQTLICAKRYGFKTILWSVMAEDWRGNTAWQEIAAKLIKRTKNGDIVCLHDGRGKNDAPSRTIEALESILPIWIYQGYRFARIDECYK